MIVLLKIGYMTLALPNEKGVATILRALGQAQKVKEDRRWNNGGLDLESSPLEVSVEMLPKSWKFTKRKPSESYLDPEILPPIKGDLPANHARNLLPPASRQLGQGQTALQQPSLRLIGGVS